MRRGPVSRSLGTALAELERLGQLEKADQARVAGIRAAAALVDAARADPEESRYTVRAILAEYGAWVDRVFGRAVTPGAVDDELTGLLNLLASPLGDPPQP